MLSTDSRFFGSEVVEPSGYLHSLFSVSTAFFVALLVVIQKVLPLNHKDVGICCNKRPNV